MKGLLIQNLPATERDDVFVSLRGENQEKRKKGGEFMDDFKRCLVYCKSLACFADLF